MMSGGFLLALFLLGGPPEVDAKTSSPNAEALFREGLKAYDAHDFPRALASFEAAYKLTPLPEILFDIAMTHRSAGDCAHAAKSFDAFVAVAAPTDPLLPRAQARRRELGSCATQLPSAPAVPDPVAAARVSPIAAEPVTAPRSSPGNNALSPTTITLAAQPRRTWMPSTCAASIGGGLALGVAGAVFGVGAWSAAREAEMAKAWDENAQRADERAHNFRLASSALLISAGVASLVALGTCSYGSWWGRDKSPPTP